MYPAITQRKVAKEEFLDKAKRLDIANCVPLFLSYPFVMFLVFVNLPEVLQLKIAWNRVLNMPVSIINSIEFFTDHTTTLGH